LFTDILQQWDARGEPDAPMTVVTRVMRGENRRLAGRLTAAHADFEQATTTARRTMGVTHMFLALGIRGMARVDMDRGRLAEAESGLKNSLVAFGRLRPTHNYVLATRRSLAEVTSLRGRHAEADTMLRDVVKLEREELPKGHVEIGRALQAYGEVKLLMGDAKAAETLLREAREIRVSALGVQHWLVAETESLLGQALAAQDRHAEAKPMLTGAYERLLAQRGADDRRTREARARLER
jgi:hypothetical protein